MKYYIYNQDISTEVMLNVIEHFRVHPDLDIYMAPKTSF